MVFIIDELTGGSLDVGCGDTVNAGKDLCIAHTTSVRKHLVADVVGSAGVIVLLQHELRLKGSLCSLNLRVRNVVAATYEIVKCVPHGVLT